MKIAEIEAHSSFENGKRALVLAHALRASHSSGSPWVEQTRYFDRQGLLVGSVDQQCPSALEPHARSNRFVA